MSNTLLNISMILAKAMYMAYVATEDDDEPFEITVDFVYPSCALTYNIDDFAKQYLRPAIDAALEQRSHLAEWREFERHYPESPDLEFCNNSWGIAGRLLRRYDISEDMLPTRIEMRAAAGEIRREATRLIMEEQEARRRRSMPITQERQYEPDHTRR